MSKAKLPALLYRRASGIGKTERVEGFEPYPRSHQRIKGRIGVGCPCLPVSPGRCGGRMLHRSRPIGTPCLTPLRRIMIMVRALAIETENEIERVFRDMEFFEVQRPEQKPEVIVADGISLRETPKKKLNRKASIDT